MKQQLQPCEDGSSASVGETLDSGLARRIVLKDPEAMAELYDRYGAVAYSVLLRMLRDPCVAEELTQEVFLRLWNRIDRFDERRGELKRWIAAIARNKALDYLRSSDARARRRELGFDRLPGSPRENSLEEQIVTKDLVRASRTAMQHLTEKQREVFCLTYFQGKTQVEIAVQLKAPLGSVKTWVRTGLQRLRKELAIAPREACMCSTLYR
jgi:RNA polymerase sigma-70 factor, ECF subfamily